MDRRTFNKFLAALSGSALLPFAPTEASSVGSIGAAELATAVEAQGIESLGITTTIAMPELRPELGTLEPWASLNDDLEVEVQLNYDDKYFTLLGTEKTWVEVPSEAREDIEWMDDYDGEMKQYYAAQKIYIKDCDGNYVQPNEMVENEYYDIDVTVTFGDDLQSIMRLPNFKLTDISEE